MFSRQAVLEQPPITEEMTAHLPDPVQRWLTHSGIIGREKIYAVRLEQKAEMKMKPEQKKWTAARAVQYFTVDEPAFVWKVDMNMLPLVPVAGRDKFVEGVGEMLIKIFAVIPVVDTGGNEKINTAALQRYLGELVWFPSAALSPYITWEKIDDFSAKATMTHKGTQGTGVFTFDEKGDFVRYSALRYWE